MDGKRRQARHQRRASQNAREGGYDDSEAEAPGGQAEVPPDLLQKDSQCRIRNFVGRIERNGAAVCLGEWCAQRERWSATVLGGNERIEVKPEKLCPILAPAGGLRVAPDEAGRSWDAWSSGW